MALNEVHDRVSNLGDVRRRLCRDAREPFRWLEGRRVVQFHVVLVLEFFLLGLHLFASFLQALQLIASTMLRLGFLRLPLSLSPGDLPRPRRRRHHHPRHPHLATDCDGVVRASADPYVS